MDNWLKTMISFKCNFNSKSFYFKTNTAFNLPSMHGRLFLFFLFTLEFINLHRVSLDAITRRVLCKFSCISLASCYTNYTSEDIFTRLIWLTFFITCYVNYTCHGFPYEKINFEFLEDASNLLLTLRKSGELLM